MANKKADAAIRQLNLSEHELTLGCCAWLASKDVTAVGSSATPISTPPQAI